MAPRLVERIRAPAAAALSVREIEVLELVAWGRTNKEIALGLHLSQATVKTHLLHIFSKLQVYDRTQAVTAALEAGVLRLDV